MAAINELLPTLDRFTENIRDAKFKRQLTIEKLVELTGLSVSTVTKIVTGKQTDPKISTAAAMCYTLGLSLDELCGLAPSAPPDEELQNRVHDLELKNACKSGQIKELRARIAATHPLVYSLCAICIALLVALIAYLLGDFQHENIGLIQSGVLSKAAWALVSLIAVALGNTAALIWMICRRRKEQP